MRAYRENATEAAAKVKTAEAHNARKSADSDLVDTIDLSNLLTNSKSRSDHSAPSPLDFARADEALFDNHAQSETVRIPSKQEIIFQGADSQTPDPEVMENHVFTGTRDGKTGLIEWDKDSYTYPKISVPVVQGYFADQKEAGFNVVTPYVPTVTEHVTYRKLGRIIPVTEDGEYIPGALTKQYNNNKKDPRKAGETATPAVQDYMTDIKSVVPNKPGGDTPVVYRKIFKKASITYIDETTGAYLVSDQLTGELGEAIEYGTATRIKTFKDMGYDLIQDEFPKDAIFDDKDIDDQEWFVLLQHDVAKVGPDHEQVPDTPINPNNPDGPKWPSKYAYEKEVSFTVFYKSTDGNADLPDADVQKAYWVRTLTFDKVTGELVDETEWSPNKTKYYDIYAPVVLGYFADRVEVKGREVTEDNIEETITYVPLGKIIPIDANGRLIPNVPTPTFNNDANNPTKVSETLVPHIPGYRPMQQSVMPESLTDDILVEYAPILEDVTQPTLQTVFFKGAGEATPSVNIQSDFTFTGQYNQAEDTYTWDQDSYTFAKVNVPVIEGYYADKAVAGMQVVTPDKPEATDSVVYKELGKIIPVDTFGNPIADAEPVHYANDPQDATQVIETPAPQVAGYQAESELVLPIDLSLDQTLVYEPILDDITQDTKQTVTFQGAGYKDPVINIQDSFSFHGKFNQVEQTSTWDQDSFTYDVVEVPVVEGFYADKRQAGGLEVRPDLPEVEDTVTYTELGKIIPVDEYGTPIENAPTPSYNNDPEDPTMAMETVVPDVLGYISEKTFITPEHPGQDTNVVYAKDEQKAIILYMNELDKSELTRDVVVGSSGEKIDYSTDEQIANLLKQGYELVNDGYAEAFDHTYNGDSDFDQVFEVVLRERLVLIDPDMPAPVAGEVVDPNDVNSPVWPNSVEMLENRADVTRTIQYVFEEGGLASDDYVEVLDFKRLANVNLVTGAINYEAWSSTQAGFSAVPSPEVVGFTPDRMEVAEMTDVSVETPEIMEVVTYLKDAQKATVTYVDGTTRKKLEVVDLLGKSGEVIDYSTIERIKYYSDRGYTLLADGFTNGVIFDGDSHVDQNFMVTLRHGTVQVGPDNIQEAGTPINPAVPDGAKWPERESYIKDVTFTVLYTSSDGQAELPANNIQTAQWTRTLTIDKVTGEELGSSYWTSNKGQFETVITPEVEGYSADKDKVEGKTVGQRNLEETVVYIPLTGDINGKPKENKVDDIVVEEVQDLEILDQADENTESRKAPTTYGPDDDFEAPVSSQDEGKGSKHKMPINLSNEEEANKGKIEETINIAGFTVSVTGLGLGRNGRKKKNKKDHKDQKEK